MSKKRLYLAVLLIFMTLLVGCGNSKMSEKEIQSNLETYLQYGVLDENEKLIEIDITERQTEKKKRDSIWCTIITEDGECRYEKRVALVYVLNSEGDWLMDEFSMAERNAWSITPISGVNKENVTASLSGMTFIANNEIWNITDDNIENISIVDQKTDIEVLTDTVTVNVTVSDKVQRAKGQVVLHYIFEDKWILDSMSENESFTTETKAGLALDMTEEALFDVLSGQVFEYGLNVQQEITLGKNELSDFIIEKKESSQKGSVETYFCRGTLTKPHAVFSLEIEIPYFYSDGWQLQQISVVANCTFVEIAGKWTGVNNWGNSYELDIIEMDSNSNINAIFETKSAGGYKECYYVSGSLDWNNLRLNLEAGEVISGYSGHDVSARLNVDDSTISGTVELSNFTLAQ